jgi:hypothetical protein
MCEENKMTPIKNHILSMEVGNLKLVISSKPKHKFQKTIEVIEYDHGTINDYILYFNFGFSTKKVFNKYLDRYSISLFNPFYVKFVTELYKFDKLINNQLLIDNLCRKICLLFINLLEKRFQENDEFIVFDFYLSGPITCSPS